MQFPNRTNRTLLSLRDHAINTTSVSGWLTASVSWMERFYFIVISIISNYSFKAGSPLERTAFPASNSNQLAYA